VFILLSKAIISNNGGDEILLRPEYTPYDSKVAANAFSYNFRNITNFEKKW
jgi:hypothetical protein